MAWHVKAAAEAAPWAPARPGLQCCNKREGARGCSCSLPTAAAGSAFVRAAVPADAEARLTWVAASARRLAGAVFLGAEMCMFSLGAAVNGPLSSSGVVSHASSTSGFLFRWCACKAGSSENLVFAGGFFGSKLCLHFTSRCRKCLLKFGL